MYNNKYGYGVYKRNQVNIGNPYKLQKREVKPSIVEDIFEEVAAAKSDPDMELKISQDIVYKAKEDAALIKREAELEAERMLSEASEKVEQLITEAQQKGKEEGYRFGEELAQQHYSDLIAEALDFKERSKQEYEETILSLEQDIVKLVLDISAKVIGDLVRDHEEAIVGIVRETINSCSNRENVILKVSPEDYDIVAKNEEALKSTIKGLNELEIRKDMTLTKGSCVIDTDFGSVDGSCDVRIESIRKAFFELMGDNGQENEK